MLDDLASGREIAAATQELLAAADIRGRLPTPVDDLVAAARLSEPTDSLLADSTLAQAPSYLREAVARLKRKVRALLDRKEREIHLDPSVDNDGKRRFLRLHEVGHDILPWQAALAYGDDDSTLSWATRVRFEREANQTAAELLFQRELFTQMAREYAIGIAAVTELADLFGSSVHSAFRRYVETHHAPLAGLVLEPSPRVREPLVYARRETMHSAFWGERFATEWPGVLNAQVYPFVAEAERARLWVRRLEFTWPDLANQPTPLIAEVHATRFYVLVLLFVPQRERLKRRRVLLPGRATQ